MEDGSGRGASSTWRATAPWGCSSTARPGFPRARTLPGGAARGDAILVTCAYLADAQTPWVLQSLFLAAIGECKDRGFPFQAFSHRDEPEADFAARFLGHRTIFPDDFLRDLGFQEPPICGDNRAGAARPAHDRDGGRAEPDGAAEGAARAVPTGSGSAAVNRERRYGE